MILRSGSVVRLRSGLVVVLLNNKHEMWWNCKVISSDQAYQIGDILAHSDDLREGVEITRFLGDGE